MHGAARRRRAEGADVVDSTLGALLHDDGRLAVLPSVVELVGSLPPTEVAGYPPLTGRPDLIAAIQEDVLPPGPLRSQATSVITPGGTGAIYQGIVNFLDPGQVALSTDLTWGPYRSIAVQNGRGLELFPMFDEEGGFRLDALEEAVGRLAATQGRVLLILNSPCQNPTGYALTREDWAGVADVLTAVPASIPVTLLLDLAYLRYARGEAAWWPAVDRVLERGAVLLAWTASKTFTQYGARVGALVALHRDEETRGEIARALNFAARGTWSACNHAGQRAVTRLLVEPELAARVDQEREGLRALLDERWAAFAEAAEGTGLRIPPWSGGFFTCVRTPDAAGVADALMERDVFVVPVEGAVRIALCATRADQMGRLVEALESVGAAD
jgi:aromatic-amino-acid transaminase